MILVVVLMPKVGDEAPIRDVVLPTDSSTVELETSVGDKPEVSDSASFEGEEEANFTIDENGTKHYVIEARDVPQMGDK